MTSVPRRSIWSARRQGSGGAAVQLKRATRSSMARWEASSARRSGQARPQWFHNSCAPTWSSHSRPRKSQPRPAAARWPRSCTDSARHCARVPSCAAPQRPSRRTHGPSGVSVRSKRGEESDMGQCKKKYRAKAPMVAAPCRAAPQRPWPAREILSKNGSKASEISASSYLLNSKKPALPPPGPHPPAHRRTMAATAAQTAEPRHRRHRERHHF